MEVTALAANSMPTIKLRNTCADITEQDIFKLPVRVLVIRDDEGDGEHLKMAFGEIDEEEANNRPRWQNSRLRVCRGRFQHFHGHVSESWDMKYEKGRVWPLSDIGRRKVW